MAKGFNKVVLLGNLTRDPELRTTPNGNNVCNFSLAVNRTWRNADGEQQEDVDFIDCTAWGKAAELIEQYTSKGRALLVSGRLRQDTWEQDGNKRSKLEVVVEDFNFISGGDDSRGDNGASRSNTKQSDTQQDKQQDKQDVEIEDMDEDVDLSEVPF